MRRLIPALVLAVVVAACTGSDDDADRTEPTAGTTQPSATEAPPGTTQHGTVSIDVSDLVGSTGSQLAGVLLNRDSPPDGIAGFAVMVDSDPFSGIRLLGNVDEEWGGDTGLWPWASGVAEIPAGDYTLLLAVGTDYCCYSRWMPAEAPDLRVCDLRVTITGDDQIIRITDIPTRGTCGS